MSNDSFMLGSPKIKTFRYQEITLGAELIPSSRPGTSTTPIRRQQPSTLLRPGRQVPNSAISRLTTTVTVATSVSGQAVPGNLRCVRLWLTPANVELTVSNYYGELASVNYRPRTKILGLSGKSAADLSRRRHRCKIQGSLPQSRLRLRRSRQC